MTRYKIVTRDHEGNLITLQGLDFKLKDREAGFTAYQKAKGWYNRMLDIDPDTSPEIVHLDPDHLPVDGYNRIQARVKDATRLLSVEKTVGTGLGDFTPGLCLVMALKEIARLPVKHPGEDHKTYLTKAGYYLALVAPRLAPAVYREYQDRILRKAAPRQADASGQLLTITAHLAGLAPKIHEDPRNSQRVADAGYCLVWLGMIPIWDPTAAVTEAEARANGTKWDPTDPVSGGSYTTYGGSVDLKLTWDPSGILQIGSAETPGDPGDFKGRI